jgi:hypothetical protein
MKIILAVMVAIGCLAAAVAGSYATTIHLVDGNNAKFCQYLETVVPRTKKPSNPAKNPSRVNSYKFSLKTDQFERSIGCQ